MSKTNFPGYDDDQLRSLNAYWTAKEIQQQPEAWVETHKIVENRRAEVNDFLDKALKSRATRIILTGAGTSAIIGACIAPILSAAQNKVVESIATTDLVSNPLQYFRPDIPTLLVSFARSGNSPESTAAMTLADEIVSNCYHLVLTCNPDGDMFAKSVDSPHCLTLLMPHVTNDQSFAMTSSFSSMLLAALDVFSKTMDSGTCAQAIHSSTSQIIECSSSYFKDLAECQFDRVVYLGSGGLGALAQEAALKLLELTDGQIVAVSDSALGFRHGPKTFVNNSTLVVMFMSNDPYTRNYDLDLLIELQRDNNAARIVAISSESHELVNGNHFLIDGQHRFTDEIMMFPYAVCAQIFAFHCAINLGISPDSPNASGSVNRVVKGVTIHPYANRDTD